MLQWKSIPQGRGQSQSSQDHCADAQTFQLFLVELYLSDIAARGGYRAVTLLKTGEQLY